VDPAADDLQEARAGGVATITFNRPARRNAITAAMFERLLPLLEALAADDAVGAVVLTGAGSAFSAGGDVGEMADRDPAETPADATRTLRRRMDAARLLHEMPKPTIAMMRGPAAGAGLCLALACDLRFAGASARFTTAFARMGYAGDYGGSWFLPRLVGPAKARELYFTADALDAGEALRIGLVNRVLADDDLPAHVGALAQALAAGPRVALREIKRNLNLADEASLVETLDAEAAAQIRCRLSADHREAARAFLEKRKPVFGRG